MSAKVSRHIRKQRRARKKALKQQRRSTAAAQQQPTSTAAPLAATIGPETQPTSIRPAEPAQAASAAAPPTSAHPVALPATSRAGRASRLTALLAGCGIILTAAASVTFHILADDDPEDPRRVPANYVAAPAVTERLVCPPTPGEPESISEAGVLEYAERDDSAEASRSAVLFGSSQGVMPEASWLPLTHEGSGEAEAFHEQSEQGGGYADRLADRELIIGELEETEDPAALQIQPLDGVAIDDAPAAAVGFTYHSSAGPQSGLAAAACAMPERSQWFLGPETGSGSASLLTLTNPHSREAVVEVTTYSAEGSTGSLGSASLLVPPESTRTVNMAALTEDAAQLAVHVQASGAPVAGHLQTSRAAGGTGDGTDLLPPMSAPREEHHMMAVPAGAAERPQLWVYTPGEEGGAVELQVFDAAGQVVIDTPGVFSVEAGRVAVVDIEGLEPGTYEVVVRTEEPTLAAVRSAGDGEPVTTETQLSPQEDPVTGEQLDAESVQEETDPAPDLSWSVAAETAEPGFGVMVPQIGETELRFFGQGELTYRIFDSSGAASEEFTVSVSEPEATLVTSHDALAEQADEADLEDIFALVVTDTVGETRAGLLTRDEAGLFTIGSWEPISPAAQYVPLRFDR